MASLAEAIGYNVCRRADPASYNFSSPLNDGTPVAAKTYLDTTPVHATPHRHTLRAVIAGAGDARVDEPRRQRLGARHGGWRATSGPDGDVDHERRAYVGLHLWRHRRHAVRQQRRAG